MATYMRFIRLISLGLQRVLQESCEFSCSPQPFWHKFHFLALAGHPGSFLEVSDGGQECPAFRCAIQIVSVQITYALFRCYLISLPSLGQTFPGRRMCNMKSDLYVKCISESESSSLPRVGLTRSDVGYMASASGDRNLDAEHLARNRIVKVSDDQFSCAL